jgi:hypothetical protein
LTAGRLDVIFRPYIIHTKMTDTPRGKDVPAAEPSPAELRVQELRGVLTEMAPASIEVYDDDQALFAMLDQEGDLTEDELDRLAGYAFMADIATEEDRTKKLCYTFIERSNAVNHMLDIYLREPDGLLESRIAALIEAIGIDELAARMGAALHELGPVLGNHPSVDLVDGNGNVISADSAAGGFDSSFVLRVSVDPVDGVKAEPFHVDIDLSVEMEQASVESAANVCQSDEPMCYTDTDEKVCTY